jgi:hypothetical protein
MAGLQTSASKRRDSPPEAKSKRVRRVMVRRSAFAIDKSLLEYVQLTLRKAGTHVANQSVCVYWCYRVYLR